MREGVFTPFVVFLGSAAAWGIRMEGGPAKIAEVDGVVYSLYADRTRLVETASPGRSRWRKPMFTW